MPRPGFSRPDLLAILASASFLAVIVCVLGAGPSPTRMEIPGFSNLRTIAHAAGGYQLDFQGHLPLAPIWRQRGVGPSFPGQNATAWCGWTFGGKNTSSYWATSVGGIFDVEAADRPLNAYVYPGRTFYAPAPPARLPANDPARATTQADVFRHPSDTTTRQRNWPQQTASISCYNDVGTSYMLNGLWVTPLQQQYTFTNAYLNGMNRIASGQGVTPSRFVWCADQYAEIVIGGMNVPNDVGEANTSLMLFLDGHAANTTVTPGQANTPSYQFQLE